MSETVRLVSGHSASTDTMKDYLERRGHLVVEHIETRVSGNATIFEGVPGRGDTIIDLGNTGLVEYVATVTPKGGE